MRIETPSLIQFPQLPRAAAERVEAAQRSSTATASNGVESTDVVQLSDAAEAWLDPSDQDAQPTPMELWEEARQSLLRDPMEPEPGEEEGGPFDLSDEEQAVVDKLRARDAAVRAHEAAHAAIGGGTPSYDYKTGPDGKQYAVGGQVVLDASGGSTAQGTIDRMRRLRAAALAPGSPSAQDRFVAAEATQREAAARSRQSRRQAAESVRESGATVPRGEQQRAASAFESQQQRAMREDPTSRVAWA